MGKATRWDRIRWWFGYHGIYQIIWWWRERKLEPTKVYVDDWPEKLNVGDCVMYQFERWIIEQKWSDKWHADKPTFALRRGFNKRLEV